MTINDIRHMDKEAILSLMGLEAKRSIVGRVLSTFGVLCIGVVVGAAAALLLAPQAGSALRKKIRTRVRPEAVDSGANGVEASQDAE